MSSSSVVCQGLHPCLEPGRFVDPRLPLLKMAPWVSSMEQVALVSDDKAEETQNSETSGWSLLQSFISKTDVNCVYVHPLAHSASGKLSKRSLEMCTEGLGSETGNSVIDDSEEISLLSLPKNCSKREALRPRDGENGSNRVVAVSFPPPITSMSGVRVKPHRQGGRLVLEAESVSCSVSCFHVERSQGRLRLCLLRDSPFDTDV